MKTIHKTLFLLSSLYFWLAVTGVIAETALPDSKDMPGEPSKPQASSERQKVCFADMCLGQEIQTGSIKWKTLKPREYGQYQLSMAKQFLSKNLLGLTPSEVELLVPYIMLTPIPFDDEVLKVLKNRKPILCKAFGFRGEFDSVSGHRTEVNLNYDLDRTWRISSIRRLYVGINENEKTSLLEKLHKAYSQLPKSILHIGETPTAYGNGVDVSFNHPLWNSSDIDFMRWGEGFEATRKELLKEQLKKRTPGDHRESLDALVSNQDKCKRDTPLD